jgi:hypothetical protein
MQKYEVRQRGRAHFEFSNLHCSLIICPIYVWTAAHYEHS